jgi:hypothetical protein
MNSGRSKQGFVNVEVRPDYVIEELTVIGLLAPCWVAPGIHSPNNHCGFAVVAIVAAGEQAPIGFLSAVIIVLPPLITDYAIGSGGGVLPVWRSGVGEERTRLRRL